jgi:hypothetical protein
MSDTIDTENSEEALIITGMVVNTEFLKRITSVPLLKLLQNKFSKIMAIWILEYFSAHQKAPDYTIEEIANAKLKKIDPTIAKIILHTLNDISEKYVDSGTIFDFDYNIIAAETYLQSRALILRKEEEDRLLENGKVLEAYKLGVDFKLPILTIDPSKKALSEVLPEMAISFDALNDMSFKKKQYLLYGEFPLEKSSITLVVGEAGGGKTWFLYELAKTIGSACIGLSGTCNASEPVKTLIVDGELPINEIQDRSAILELDNIRHLTLISKSYLEKNDVVPPLNLNESSVRDILTDYIVENKFELLILDNLFSLFGGMDLNSAEEWEPANSWLLKLRSKGVATILCHHIGKSGDQLGSIAKTFNINTHLLVKKETPRDEDSDCCCFSIQIKKQRGTGIRLQGKKFIFRNKVWSTEPFSGKPAIKQSKSKKYEPEPEPTEPTPRPSLTSGLRDKPIFKVYKKEE